MTTPFIPGTQADQAYPASTWPAAAPKRKPMLLWVLLGLAVLAVVAAVAVAVTLAVTRHAAPVHTTGEVVGGGQFSFTALQSECDPTVKSTVIGDNGATLILSDPSMVALTCVLDGTHAPASVRAQLSETRALDGRQTATWSGYSASWTYHPDAGVNMVLTQA